MKTQGIIFDQALLDITKLIATSVKDFKVSKLSSASKFTIDKVGYYLLPLVKQIFRDNFMGSDAEMGILLVFLKGYFFSAADAVANNVITDFFKRIKNGDTKVVAFDIQKIKGYKEAA